MTALEAVFSWVLTTTWQASVLAVLVLAAQWLLGVRLNPRWRYALWLLVLLRLVLPDVPESALSLFRYAPAAPLNLPETISAPEMSAPVMTTAPALPHVMAVPQPNYTFLILATLWLSGALGLLLLTFLVNRRFARHVANAPQITDESLRQIFADAKAELGIRRHIRLVESTHVSSPAIMGLFTSTLLLPTSARDRFTPRELRFIFLHELAHLKRGDVFVQALIALLQIIHWFNPVLWYAFRRLRADREPATDALVLSRTGEADKEPYGLMLLKLLEHFNQRHALPTLVGILEDKDQFKRRFSLIAKFTRGAYGWSLLGVALLALLAVVCLTKAKAQDEPSEAGKYLELVFVEEPGAINGSGSGPRRAQDMAKLLNNPKNKVTVMADLALKSGPVSLKGQSPAGFSVTITGDWNASLKTPQKIGYRIDEAPTTNAIGITAAASWETKDVLSQDSPLVIFQPWKPDAHANVIIQIVDHPASANAPAESPRQSSDAGANPKAASTGGTLAQLVLALHEQTKSIPSDHQHLQILQGFYGADGSWRDVTGILQKSIQNDSLKVSWQQPYTEIGGDPAYGHVKTLVVSYRLDGVVKLATFGENDPTVGLQATIPTKDDATSSDTRAPTSDPALDQKLVDLVRNPSTDKVGAGDADKVAQLLAQGADPNAKSNGTPALFWALNFGKDDAAVALIQKGADVNAISGQLLAVEMASMVYYCPNALEVLLKKGAPLKPLGVPARSVLSSVFSAPPAKAGKMNYLHDRAWTDADYQAWVQRQRRVIDLLAAAGVDLNGVPGETPPLIQAIRFGHLDGARELLRLGAKTDVHDAGGETPQSTAQQHHPEFLPELEAAAKRAHEAGDDAPHQLAQPFSNSSQIPAGQKPLLNLDVTLVEVSEKTYQAQRAAMDQAVTDGNLGYFAARKDVFISREKPYSFASGKGWYSEGVVLSYIQSASYDKDKVSGKVITTLQASAVFLGLNADFKFNVLPSAVISADSTWQLTEPGTNPAQVPHPDATPAQVPSKLDLSPKFNVAQVTDTDWRIVPGRNHALWIAPTLGQVTRTSLFQDETLTTLDGMAKNKVPSRLAVFLSATPVAVSDPLPAIAALVSSAPNATTDSAAPDGKDIAALVNGKPVYWWLIRYGRLAPKSLEARKAELQAAIDNELIVQEDDADKNDPNYVPDYLKQSLDFAINGFHGDQGAFVANLKANGLTLENFAELRRREAILGYFENTQIYGPARAYVQNHPPPAATSPAGVADAAKQRQDLLSSQTDLLRNQWTSAHRAKATIHILDPALALDAATNGAPRVILSADTSSTPAMPPGPITTAPSPATYGVTVLTAPGANKGSIALKYGALAVEDSVYTANRATIDHALNHGKEADIDRLIASLPVQVLNRGEVFASPGILVALRFPDDNGAPDDHDPMSQLTCVIQASGHELTLTGTFTANRLRPLTASQLAQLQSAGEARPTIDTAQSPFSQKMTLDRDDVVLLATVPEPGNKEQNKPARRLFFYASAATNNAATPQPPAPMPAYDHKALRDEFLPWLDHAKPEEKPTMTRAFEAAYEFLTALDTGNKGYRSQAELNPLQLRLRWPAYVDPIHARYGEVVARHLKALGGSDLDWHPEFLHELGFNYETTYLKGNVRTFLKESVTLERTPAYDPNGQWNVIFFALCEKDASGKWQYIKSLTGDPAPASSPAPPSPDSPDDAVADKLDTVHVELSAFSNAALNDVVVKLSQAIVRGDPAHEGFNFVVPQTAKAQAIRLDLPALKDVPAIDALAAIAKAAQLTYKMDARAIYLQPRDDDGENALTVRTFLVPLGFLKAVNQDQTNVESQLLARGVPFIGNASAIYLPALDKLVIRDTPDALDKLQSLVEAVAAASPAPPVTDPLPNATLPFNQLKLLNDSHYGSGTTVLTNNVPAMAVPAVDSATYSGGTTVTSGSLIVSVPPTPTTVDVTGTITDTDGNPVPDARVIVNSNAMRPGFKAYTPGSPDPSLDFKKVGLGDAKGRFILGNVSHDVIFTLLAEAPGHSPAFLEDVDPTAGPVHFVLPRLPAGQAGAPANGHLVDAQGRPVADAKIVRVSLVHGDTTLYTGVPGPMVIGEATSDSGGNFSFPFQAGQQAIGVEIVAPGYARQIVSLLAFNGLPREIRLAPGITVTGRVLNHGTPLAGIQVGIAQTRTYSRSDLGEIAATTGSDGRFVLHNVAAGDEYEVYAKRDSLGLLGVPVKKIIKTETPGSSIDVGDLGLKPGIRIDGNITFANGAHPSLSRTVQLHVGRDTTSDYQYVDLGPDLKFTLLARSGETIGLSAWIPGYHLAAPNEVMLITVAPDHKSIEMKFVPDDKPPDTNAAPAQTSTSAPALAVAVSTADGAKQLLQAKEDADARRVLVTKLKELPDDEFVSTLQGLNRAAPALAALNEKIAVEKADITKLLNDGFTPGHPRIFSMRAEVTALEQQRKELIDGERRAMDIDLQAADARVTSLAQAGAAPAAGMPGRLLEAQEDANARRVLVGQLKKLTGDQFVSTLQGLGRSDPALTDLDEKIASEKTDITNLLSDGFDANHPRIVSMRAEVAAREQQRAQLVAGLREAMDIDLQMADSRVELLKKQVNATTPGAAPSTDSTPASPAQPPIPLAPGALNLPSRPPVTPQPAPTLTPAAYNPADANADAPAVAEPSKPRGEFVRTAVKVLEIGEEDYQAHRAEIDAAVQRGDSQPLMMLPSYHELSNLAVLVKSGERGVMEAVSVLKYPIAYSKDVTGQSVPSDYARRNLGVRVEIFPEVKDGRIQLTAKPQVTCLAAWIGLNTPAPEPAFNVQADSFSDIFSDGQSKGCQFTQHMETLPLDPSYGYLPGTTPDPARSRTMKGRLFYFLTVREGDANGFASANSSVVVPANATPSPSLNSAPASPANFQEVTVSGQFKLLHAAPIDWGKSTGSLQSVDGGYREFYFQPDGRFTIPGLKPGVYNWYVNAVPSDPLDKLTGKGVVSPNPLTVDGSAARMTANATIDVQVLHPPKGSVQIGLKLLEIDDHLYQANKARMDTAVERGDIAYFVNLEHVSMLSTPSVTTTPGTKANIDIVREFPYPTQFEPSKLVPNQKVTLAGSGTQMLTLMVPPTPREFVTKDLGVSAEITPTINGATTLAPGKIVLLGKVTVSDFEGFAKSNVDGVAGMPSFSTSETNFLEQVGDRELKGVWIPGLHAEEPPAADKNAPPYASTSPGASVKRMLLFVSATRVP